jgi:hypothetical protein
MLINCRIYFTILLLVFIAGCTTTEVDPGDTSAPSLRVTYRDANTPNGTFGTDRAELTIAANNQPSSYINAIGQDNESGIASIELTIDADVACEGLFGSRGVVQWSSRARWTVRNGRPAGAGTTDYVSGNVIASLTPEKFAREADCFDNPRLGETSRVEVNVLNARLIARACNNTSRPASRCTVQSADFILHGEENTQVVR